MDFQTIKEYFSPENMDHIVESYKAFDTSWYWFTDDRGVDSSITAYCICTGECCCIWLWLGFLYSWLGSVMGALLVFSSSAILVAVVSFRL